LVVLAQREEKKLILSRYFKVNFYKRKNDDSMTQTTREQNKASNRKKYTFYFLYDNVIRIRGSVLRKIQEQIKNNPSLGKRTKSQNFNFRTNICS